MDEDVRLKLAEEEQRERARIGAADRPRVDGALEVAADRSEHEPRRRLRGTSIERNDERRLPRGEMHLHRDRGADDRADERDELLGETSEHDPRIHRRIDARQLFDERRHADVARAHRGAEELLLRRHVPQNRRRRDAEIVGDVGQRRGGKSAIGEGVSGGFEDLFAGDARGASHR